MPKLDKALSTFPTDKGFNSNSAGVLGCVNRAVSNISHTVSPGPFCIHENDTIECECGLICPDCGTRLIAVSKILKALPFDDTVEAHVHNKGVYCPAQGCGYKLESQPSVQGSHGQ